MNGFTLCFFSWLDLFCATLVLPWGVLSNSVQDRIITASVLATLKLREMRWVDCKIGSQEFQMAFLIAADFGKITYLELWLLAKWDNTVSLFKSLLIYYFFFLSSLLLEPVKPWDFKALFPEEGNVYFPGVTPADRLHEISHYGTFVFIFFCFSKFISPSYSMRLYYFCITTLKNI